MIMIICVMLIYQEEPFEGFKSISLEFAKKGRTSQSLDEKIRSARKKRKTQVQILCSNSCLRMIYRLYEPHHEKTCLWGLRPGKTQTGH